MIKRKQSHSEGMDYPLGLQLQLGRDRCPVRPKLEEHLLRVINSPGCVVDGAGIMLRSIVDSTFSSGDGAPLGTFRDIFLSFLYFSEIIGIFLAIDIVGVAILREEGFRLVK